MANMATRPLAMFRSNTSPRLFSSSAATTKKTKTKTKPAARRYKEKTLLHKLSAIAAGADPKVADTLDDWIKEGNPIKRSDIVSAISMFRKTKKHLRAIELYQWIETGKSEIQMSNADRARFIELIIKTEGLASAEKHFNSLQDSAKTQKTYEALLRGYCKQKMLDNAVELFEKMKELDFVSSFNYANMMSLYTSVGKPDKALLLSKEMEDKKIPADVYTYNHLINTYASLGDYDAVDGVIEKMETNNVKCDWITYGNLAYKYIKAGLMDKADFTLRKLERMENLRDREAFHTLISLYSQSSNKYGVYRAWESLNSKFPKINVSYLVYLLALSKLGDYDGLEKCYREWESSCSTYDVRVSNIILKSYLDRDMITEANLVYESIAERGAKPNLRTLDLFTYFYLATHQMDLALKNLEIGASVKNKERVKSFPGNETVGKFLKYFEEKKDAESAERFCESMKKLRPVDAKVYDSLLQTYIASGKLEPGMWQRLEDEDIEISPEIEKLVFDV